MPLSWPLFCKKQVHLEIFWMSHTKRLQYFNLSLVKLALASHEPVRFAIHSPKSAVLSSVHFSSLSVVHVLIVPVPLVLIQTVAWSRSLPRRAPTQCSFAFSFHHGSFGHATNVQNPFGSLNFLTAVTSILQTFVNLRLIWSNWLCAFSHWGNQISSISNNFWIIKFDNLK